MKTLISQWNLGRSSPNLQNRACFSEPVKMSPRSAMLKTDENLNISAESRWIYTKSSEQGLFFQAGRNESKECYATIKTDKNSNISVESQPICTEPSEQGSFFQAGQNDSRECYAMIKTEKT